MIDDPKHLATFTLAGAASRVRFCDDTVEACSGSVDLIIADQNTVRMLENVVDSIPVEIVPAGEACKDWDVVRHVLDACVRHGLDRDSTILGFGGGAVCDLAAFAASIYLRGVACVLVPTTLLAMVDAAIGGKTGIDLEGLKNIVGTFAPAREIRIRPGYVDTLSDREYRSGLAEVVKAALLGDAELLSLLETQMDSVMSRSHQLVEELVSRAARVKIDVVERDFREHGVRATLNLGHTFGHALETCLGLGTVTHGEAVAWGISRATRLASARVPGATDWGQRTRRLLERYGYDTGALPAAVDRNSFIAAMYHDKKVRQGQIRVVFQTGPQQTEVETVQEDEIRAAIEIGGQG